MSWTDDEIDKLFKEASGQPVFEYKASYFQAIEEQLPVQKSRKIGLWWWTANVFLVAFVGLMFGEKETLVAIKFTENIGKNTTVTTKAQFAQIETNKHEHSTSKGYTVNGESEEQTEKVRSSNESINLSGSLNTLITSTQVGKSTPEMNVVLDPAQGKNRTFNQNDLPSENETNRIDRLPLLDIAHHLNRSLEEIEMNNVKPKFVKNSFYLGINAGEEQAWSSDKSINQKIHETFGLELGYSIPMKRFTVSAGLGFQTTMLKDLKINERTKMYDFGSSILNNSYQFNSICAITLPLELSKSFGRHQLAFGITPSLNLFTHVRHYQEIDGMESLNERGITNSTLFNRFGLSPHISYGLSLTESIQLGVNLQIQMLQPIRSQRFVGEATNKPIGAQLFIRKSLTFR